MNRRTFVAALMAGAFAVAALPAITAVSSPAVAAEKVPLFGVEIRSAPYQGGVVASVCNHLREPQFISLAGLPAGSRIELVTGRTLDDTVTAEPMVPLLIKAHSL